MQGQGRKHKIVLVNATEQAGGDGSAVGVAAVEGGLRGSGCVSSRQRILTAGCGSQLVLLLTLSWVIFKS